MPFGRTQAILKTVLPEKTFESLYNTACNAYDVYQHILDSVVWFPQYAFHLIKGDSETAKGIRYVQKVLPYTMTSRIGVLKTHDVTRQAINNTKGSLVECGVARGGCSALMALLAKEENKGRETWLFDSFEGLPEQSEEDGIQKPVRHKDKVRNDLAEGYCLGNYDEVFYLLYHKLGLSLGNVFMRKGWFQDTLPSARLEIGDIAVLRLDSDWYESTRCCLENLYDNVVAGGWMIIDDYQLPGCKKAVDDYLGDRNLHPIMSIDANGRAYWRKK